MTAYNRVTDVVDCGDFYEVKVRVEIGQSQWTGVRVYRVTKAECQSKGFTPRVGTKYRSNGSVQFGGRSMGHFLHWENEYACR